MHLLTWKSDRLHTKRWQTEAWTTWWVQHRRLRTTRPLSRPFRCAYSRLVFLQFRKNSSPKKLKVKKTQGNSGSKLNKTVVTSILELIIFRDFLCSYLDSNPKLHYKANWKVNIFCWYAIKGFWGQKLCGSQAFREKTQAFWLQYSTIHTMLLIWVYNPYLSSLQKLNLS